MRVDLHRPLRAWSHAFAPVVLVGEAAAGPADHRDLQFTQSLQDVVAVSACIRNLRVFADPNAAVDPSAEVLGKLAEQLPVDLRPGLVGVDGDAGGYSLLGEGGQRGSGESEDDSGEHDVAVNSIAMRGTNSPAPDPCSTSCRRELLCGPPPQRHQLRFHCGGAFSISTSALSPRAGPPEAQRRVF